MSDLPPILMALINGLIAVTLWLCVPVTVAGLLRERRAEWQQVLVRTTLSLAPLAFLLGALASTVAGSLDSEFVWLRWLDAEQVTVAASDMTPPSESIPDETESEVRPSYARRDSSIPAAGELPAAHVERTTTEPFVGHASSGSTPESVGTDAVESVAPANAELNLELEASLPFSASPISASPTSNDGNSTLSAPAQDTASWASWLPVALSAIWFALVAWALTGVAYAWRRTQRWRWSLPPVAGAPRKHVDLLAERLRFARSFELRAGSLIEPIALGARPPVVALPSEWIETIGKGGFDLLVLHEIAHLQGRDPAWKLVTAIMRSVFWPHPIIHWLARRESLLSEIVADRRVLGVTGPALPESRRGYAQLLGQLAELQLNATPVPFSSPVLGTRSELERRIRMILATDSIPRRGSASSQVTAFLAVAVLSLIALVPALGLAQAPEEKIHATFVDRPGWLVVAGIGDEERTEWLVRLAKNKANGSHATLRGEADVVIVQRGEQTWRIQRSTGQLLASGRELLALAEIDMLRSRLIRDPRQEPEVSTEDRERDNATGTDYGNGQLDIYIANSRKRTDAARNIAEESATAETTRERGRLRGYENLLAAVELAANNQVETEHAKTKEYDKLREEYRLRHEREALESTLVDRQDEYRKRCIEVEGNCEEHYKRAKRDYERTLEAARSKLILARERAEAESKIRIDALEQARIRLENRWAELAIRAKTAEERDAGTRDVDLKRSALVEKRVALARAREKQLFDEQQINEQIQAEITARFDSQCHQIRDVHRTELAELGHKRDAEKAELNVHIRALEFQRRALETERKSRRTSSRRARSPEPTELSALLSELRELRAQVELLKKSIPTRDPEVERDVWFYDNLKDEIRLWPGKTTLPEGEYRIRRRNPATKNLDPAVRVPTDTAPKDDSRKGPRNPAAKPTKLKTDPWGETPVEAETPTADDPATSKTSASRR